MRRLHPLALTLIAAFVLCAGVATAGSPEGHWEGAIEIPNMTLEITVDLAEGDDGWTGTIDIPAQNATGMALTNVTVEGDSVAFTISGAPGEPTFTGTLDGDSIKGNFSQSGQSFPFSLTRSS